jgi:hypothetical protein
MFGLLVSDVDKVLKEKKLKRLSPASLSGLA